ncbi:transcription initiation factor, partial [Zopfochytrium polystomum]
VKRKIGDLVAEIDASEKVDQDAENLLLEIADGFIDFVTHSACKMARHRGGSVVEVKDFHFTLGK